ncbi:MAG: hypothetical protein AAFX76_04050 [Planctomycetota bacterium]
MKRTSKQPLWALLIVGATLTLTGCTYYEITDPHSGKTYYTDNWNSKGAESGVIVFEDAATGSKVTLATHEIRKVSERRYKASVSKQIAEQP